MQFGQTEIEDPDPPVVADHDVARFEIPVGYAFAMRGTQSIGQGDGRLEEALERQPLLGNQLAEGLSLNQLHGDEMDGLRVIGRLGSSGFDRVDGDDVGVIERRDRFGFALEPLPSVCIVRYLGRQDLERHLPFELGVLGGKDLAHAAGPELADDLIVSQRLV